MNVKRFSLSLGLKPLAEVNLTLVYEYALERQNNKYNHVININPGKQIDIFICKLMKKSIF